MPFTSTQPKVYKPTIAGHIHGLGAYTVDEQERCPKCGYRGIVTMPQNIEICAHCQNIIGGDNLSFEEAEAIHSSARFIFEGIAKIRTYPPA